MKFFPQKTQKGFVILFTIIIATIILMIGMGIYSVATRETVLSGTAREAQYAFYAADAGIECALYGNAFLNGIFQYSNTAAFECGAKPLEVNGNGSSGTPYTFDVDISSDTADRSCAHVTVFVGTGYKRVIAQGYNMCTDALVPDTANPLLTERVLNTTYDYGTLALPTSGP